VPRLPSLGALGIVPSAYVLGVASGRGYFAYSDALRERTGTFSLLLPYHYRQDRQDFPLVLTLSLAQTFA
jgi:hypothetical protein